jgi:hypothetical protein
MPDRLIFHFAAGASLVGLAAAFLRSLFDGEPLKRALLLGSIAMVYCGALCALIIDVWPEWPPFAVVAGCGLLGFSPRLVLKRIEIAVGVVGKLAKKTVE